MFTRASVARMSDAISGDGYKVPACRCAHAGYARYKQIDHDGNSASVARMSESDIRGHPANPHIAALIRATSLFEHLLKQRLRSHKPFLREHHRLHLAHGIVDHALVVQTPEHSPIEPFPGPAIVVQRQIEQCQCGVVDFVCLESHRGPPAAGQFALWYSGSRQAQWT